MNVRLSLSRRDSNFRWNSIGLSRIIAQKKWVSYLYSNRFVLKVFLNIRWWYHGILFSWFVFYRCDILIWHGRSVCIVYNFDIACDCLFFPLWQFIAWLMYPLNFSSERKKKIHFSSSVCRCHFQAQAKSWNEIRERGKATSTPGDNSSDTHIVITMRFNCKYVTLICIYFVV